jgi:UDP-GlcNAc:undecaprenyl-phosphate GlcNAc-1-phosphate transferase
LQGIPLLGEENWNFRTLWLLMDLERDGISQFTLRRVEQLRRTIIATLKELPEN